MKLGDGPEMIEGGSTEEKAKLISGQGMGWCGSQSSCSRGQEHIV